MSDKQIKEALARIEQRRQTKHLAVRRAADRVPGMSEATWRQLAAGHVMSGGRRVARTARPDQVLDMAAAVELLAEVAELVGADREDVAVAAARVSIPDPAEEDILRLAHISTEEKLRLLQHLRELRGGK